jgi:hypothetical protein
VWLVLNPHPTGHLRGCRRRISKARAPPPPMRWYVVGIFRPSETQKLGLDSFISETWSPSRHFYHLLLERSRRAELRAVSIHPQFVLAV